MDTENHSCRNFSEATQTTQKKTDRNELCKEAVKEVQISLHLDESKIEVPNMIDES
jgi:hypothetical protein